MGASQQKFLLQLADFIRSEHVCQLAVQVQDVKLGCKITIIIMTDYLLGPISYVPGALKRAYGYAHACALQRNTCITENGLVK